MLAHLGTADDINTCAVRVSKALNYSGVIIPNITGQTYKGDDNFYYFTGAANLNRWMRKTFGCENPNLSIGEYSNSSSFHLEQGNLSTNGENLATIFEVNNGIFSMVSSDPSWATGHADILLSTDINMCDGGCHFDGPIKYIDFWQLP